MTVKEAKKAVYDFVHKGLETTEAFELAELVDDLVEIAKREQEASYDREFQRLYHLIYNQAIAAAKEMIAGNMRRESEGGEELMAESEEALNV